MATPTTVDCPAALRRFRRASVLALPTTFVGSSPEPGRSAPRSAKPAVARETPLRSAAAAAAHDAETAASQATGPSPNPRGAGSGKTGHEAPRVLEDFVGAEDLADLMEARHTPSTRVARMHTEVNYFDVLELGIDDIQSAEDVEGAYQRLLDQSVRAGSRPRSDGTSQADWRKLLQEAREVLLDPEQRRLHAESLRTEKPNNETSRARTGTAIAQRGTSSWHSRPLARHLPLRLPGTFPWNRRLPFATSADQIASAERDLTLARDLSSSLTGHHDDLDRAIADLETHLKRVKRRRWNGDPLIVLLGLITGVFLANEIYAMAIVQLVATVAYFVSSPRDPQWKLDAEQLKEDERVSEWQAEYHIDGQWHSGWRSNLMALRAERLLKASLIALVLPFVAAWQVGRHFWSTDRDHSSADSTQEAFAENVWKNVTLLVRGVLLFATVVFTAVALLYFFVYLSESPGESEPQQPPSPELEGAPAPPAVEDRSG